MEDPFDSAGDVVANEPNCRGTQAGERGASWNPPKTQPAALRFPPIHQATAVALRMTTFRAPSGWQFLSIISVVASWILKPFWIISELKRSTAL